MATHDVCSLFHFRSARNTQYFARVYTPPPPPKFESATSAQLFGGDDGIGDGSDSDDDPWSSTAGDTYAAFKVLF